MTKKKGKGSEGFEARQKRLQARKPEDIKPPHDKHAPKYPAVTESENADD